MKLKVPNKSYGLVELYQAVAKEMGHPNPDEVMFDCRNINVAKNIQDGFYAHYREVIREADPNTSDDEARVQITMTLAISGPKVDKNLADDEVEVFDGFIC